MSKRRKKSFFRRNLVSIIIVALLAVGVIFYISDVEKTEAIENKIGDSIGIKHYHILENPNDSLYIASILMENEVSILTLSETFYKDKMFWPYIFEANPQIENILSLKKGAIIRIPRVDSYLLDAQNQSSVSKANFLGDSLLTEMSKKREELLTSDQSNEW